MDQSAVFSDIFERAAQRHAKFALTAAYAFGTSAPTVLTAGPAFKGATSPVATDAPWHIGSLTKSFTASLVMRLADQGRLDIDAPVDTYLTADAPHMHKDWRQATLRQLLSHTSGLPANAPVFLTRQNYTAGSVTGRKLVLASLWQKPRVGPVGTFRYSNLGYMFVGYILETVMDTPWETLVQNEIAKPLGLTSLGFGAPDQDGAAHGHQSIFGLKRPISPMADTADNPKWLGPAGTLHLSMHDLVVWGQTHMAARTDQDTTFLTSVSSQLMATQVGQGYGLGWAIEPSNYAQPAIWHNGSNTMWYALLLMFPDADLTMAVATNVSAQRRVDGMAKALSDALLVD